MFADHFLSSYIDNGAPFIDLRLIWLCVCVLVIVLGLGSGLSLQGLQSISTLK